MFFFIFNVSLKNIFFLMTVLKLKISNEKYSKKKMAEEDGSYNPSSLIIQLIQRRSCTSYLFFQDFARCFYQHLLPHLTISSPSANNPDVTKGREAFEAVQQYVNIYKFQQDHPQAVVCDKCRQLVKELQDIIISYLNSVTLRVNPYVDNSIVEIREVLSATLYYRLIRITKQCMY